MVAIEMYCTLPDFASKGSRVLEVRILSSHFDFLVEDVFQRDKVKRRRGDYHLCSWLELELDMAVVLCYATNRQRDRVRLRLELWREHIFDPWSKDSF